MDDLTPTNVPTETARFAAAAMPLGAAFAILGAYIAGAATVTVAVFVFAAGLAAGIFATIRRGLRSLRRRRNEARVIAAAADRRAARDLACRRETERMVDRLEARRHFEAHHVTKLGPRLAGGLVSR